tara:strand:+ start:1269 stop:1580 length:312 start_codon:yes stop_codon:yes gene_type:complete
MIYCFDIDGTICTLRENSDYENAKPFPDVLQKIRELFNEGHTIKFFTARGCVSGKDWSKFTAAQLSGWNVPYHELIMNKKPHYDILIDDKAMSAMAWRKLLKQ